MVHMKKLFLFVFTILVASTVKAQFSASIGYINIPVNDEIDPYYTNGFSIGLDYDYNIVDNLNISSGLGMSMTFQNVEDSDTIFHVSILNLSIPVDLSYGFSLSPSMKLNIYAGPTFVIGLLNKANNDYGTSVNYYNDNIPEGKFDYTLKRFNLLLGGGLSLDIKEKYRIKIGYKKGLLDLDNSGEYPYKTDMITASIGYIF